MTKTVIAIGLDLKSNALLKKLNKINDGGVKYSFNHRLISIPLIKILPAIDSRFEDYSLEERQLIVELSQFDAEELYKKLLRNNSLKYDILNHKIINEELKSQGFKDLSYSTSDLFSDIFPIINLSGAISEYNFLTSLYSKENIIMENIVVDTIEENNFELLKNEINNVDYLLLVNLLVNNKISFVNVSMCPECPIKTNTITEETKRILFKVIQALPGFSIAFCKIEEKTEA